MSAANKGEVAKLQQHLSLLKEQYVKLQKQLAETERKYSLLAAAAGPVDEESFVSRLLQRVATLHEQETMSDVRIKLAGGRTVPAHRLVVAAQSDGAPAEGDVLDWSHLPADVGCSLVRWLYTGSVDLSSGEAFTLSLMRTAATMSLGDLVRRCEAALMATAGVKNCVRLYTAAEEIDAPSLQEFCSQLISTHWEEFSSEDFAHMEAQLLFRMLKTKTEFPLHSAIRLHREDVVFLYLVENSADVEARLGSVDARGDLPLSAALRERQAGIARTLLEHNADVDARDHAGYTLLHRAVQACDTYAASFLVENGCDVTAATPDLGDSALHMIASTCPDEGDDAMATLAQHLLDRGLDPNMQNKQGYSSLHLAVLAGNEPLFRLLLERGADLNLSTAEHHTALRFALLKPAPFHEHSMAAQLVRAGADTSPVYPATGDTLLHATITSDLEAAALFLAAHSNSLDVANALGETALHAACARGLAQVAAQLLRAGCAADPRARSRSDGAVGRRTPAHEAAARGHWDVLEVIVKHAETHGSVDLNTRDSLSSTVLHAALPACPRPLLARLLTAGADVDARDGSGRAPLHAAIAAGEADLAAWLLEHGADPRAAGADGVAPLDMAVRQGQEGVVEALCRRGVHIDEKDCEGAWPLWAALSVSQDVASVLIRHGADPDCWDAGPDGCRQTLLHRAIDENNQAAARFLVQAGADINSPRRPGLTGGGGEEARDGATPLHLCCQWGLADVAQALVEHGAAVNARDVNSRTPLHVAVRNQHRDITALLLCHPDVDLAARDKLGLSAFATALACKDTASARAILDKLPTAAEQTDARGRNFLHAAVHKSDVESALFLLSVHVDVNSRVQDSSQTPTLHLAATSGSELLARSLVLAGARVDDRCSLRRTALHCAAAAGHAALVTALLSDGADADAADTDGATPLIAAARAGHADVVRTLLEESRCDVEARDVHGRNVMHVLARYGKENAREVAEVVLKYVPEFPLDKPDLDGNSPLLMAYIKGNGSLCRMLVKAGACLGTINHDGITIFNYQVATKQLLFRLLDQLSQEPPWADNDTCLECAAKFGLTVRKHHCRHCGRVLCSKCSDRDVPILKYGLNKPVRVCGVCFELLQVGAA